MVTLAKTRSAQLVHFNAPSLGPKIPYQTLQFDNAMRDALQLQVIRASFGCSIIEQQNRAIQPREMALQCQYLPAIPQRIARQHTKF